MQLAREALLEGLSLFPRGTVAGLWRFSSDLTPSSNYEQVAPMASLTPANRRPLADAVGGLTAVPLGGTGLYDSVLAAVRHVRAGYDRDAVNSVVVLSDGRNEAASAHGITKPALLRALRAEADPERPVVVITVAYGPDSDTEALRAISDATGGTLHVARDPRDLPVIFRDAIGGRLTR
jgi:secreted protein with Ig-like and vWFA domain